jgi:hypothetical protein
MIWISLCFDKGDHRGWKWSMLLGCSLGGRHKPEGYCSLQCPSLNGRIGVWGRLPPITLGSFKSTFSEGLSVQHLREFTNLWHLTSQLTLQDDVLKSIVRKLTESCFYPRKKLAYNAQFAGAIHSNMVNVSWMIWVPPKCNFFISWLIIQNVISTKDQLECRGWPLSPLMNRHVISFLTLLGK